MGADEAAKGACTDSIAISKVTDTISLSLSLPTAPKERPVQEARRVACTAGDAGDALSPAGEGEEGGGGEEEEGEGGEAAD